MISYCGENRKSVNKMERRRKHEGETGEDNWQRKVEKERRKGMEGEETDEEEEETMK